MIKTGISGLNQQIKGYKPEVTMIYGGAATGKTTLCMMLALDLANKGDKVIFMDSENGFSVERANQIKNNFKYMAHNIFLFRIKNFKEQTNFFENLPRLVKGGDFSAIIIDTIGMHYRKALKDDSYSANKEINKEFDFLKQLSDKVPVIVTNQIYSKLNGQDSPVGGEMVKKLSDCVMELKKNDKRELEIKKPINKRIHFEIKEEGIVVK